jgi:hypothetical protein
VHDFVKKEKNNGKYKRKRLNEKKVNKYGGLFFMLQKKTN